MSELGSAMAAVLLVGAARSDANGDPVRLAALRALADGGELRALIEAGDWPGVDRAVRAVMPAGWEPGPEWRLRG